MIMRKPLKTLGTNAWLLACLAAATALVSAADASGPCFLPVLQSDSNGFVGLSLVNTAGLTNEASVTWTGPDGKGVRTGRLSLSPGAQRAFVVREILGTPRDPEDGWIRVDSSEPGLLSYLTSGTNGILDGAEPVSELAKTVLLDYVKVNTGFVELDNTDTSLILVNPGDTAASARVDLIALDGRPAGSLPVPVPARGSLTIRVSQSFRDVLPENGVGGRRFDGYAKAVADVGLAAWLRVDTPLSLRVLRGRAPDETGPTSLAIAGHFASGGASLYRSTLNLINAGDGPARLELLAQDDRGRAIGDSTYLTLDPGQGIREDVLSLFRVEIPDIFPPPLITGYIRIRESGGGVFRSIGDVDVYSGSDAAAVLFPIGAATSREWTLPFAISGREYFTGFAIANANELLTVQTDVSIELLDVEGLLAAPPRNISLSPSAYFTALVEQEISNGYLRIRANGPVVVGGSIGTCSGNALAFLPAFR